MEFNVLIRTVYESNDDETKYELIEDLKKQIESHQQVILPELRRLFMMLSETLAGAKKDNLILLLHQTISTLIRVLLSQEIELNFKYILQPLINNLAEPDQSIRRSTKLVIDNFLKKTRNIELIIDYLIKYGFSSENYFLREKSIGSSVRFLDICQNIFCSRSGLNDVRRLIENIIIKLNDSVENVRIKAQKVLYKIMKQKNYEGFLQVQRRLSKEHQQQMENVVNKKHLEQEDQKIKELYEKFGEINLHMFEDYQQDFIVENTDGIRKYYLYQEMPQFTKKQILSFFPLGMNGLYFNLIREDTLIDCFNESDLRVKIQASKEVLEAFEACETPEDTINDIRSYLGAFYKFITYLLSSKNLIISGNAMKIVSTLIQHSAGMQMKAYIILALPPLIGKLGEERINIRNTAFFIVRSMITSIKKHTLLKSFCLFLNDQLNNQTNPNWHIKEEILNLISVLFLCLFDGYPEEWYENAFIKELQGDDANSIRYIDMKHVLTTIALFLDDKVMKVRKAAMEALAVISSYGTHKEYILQILHEILDSKVYDQLVDKLQTGKVYFINQHGKLEMPVIEVKKYENEKDKYDERLRRYKMLLNEKLSEDESQRSLSEILEISQKGNEEDENGIEFLRREEGEREKDIRQRKLKITYYNLEDEENRLMSMRDRIKKTNDNIDKYLHNHEHDGVDSVKYDILVPIKDIPLTTYNQKQSPAKSNKAKSSNKKLDVPVAESKLGDDGEEKFDPFAGDEFGKLIFDNEEEQKKQIKREQESRYPDELKKNVYYFQPIQPKPIEKEESEKDSLDDLKVVEFEYRTDDYDPLALASKKKPANTKIDIQQRINSSLSKLNQGPNANEKFVLNLPKVIQLNEKEYDGYEYSAYNDSSIDNTQNFNNL
ncbi:hypothetical protein TTHERM_00255680 (macronuclear) [Tetrahymena thermophila SB210]|uniref:Uncharacterized protein n=1 Tax=Tetrahymena thermophila (strain SB210) TaxID=312017 RepID=Q23QL1_TETTS|nr:hypothetical protein TTHERM_00255680 [Tetrahymena thermophila SB210]EAR98877.2 hypothetical protein TTHERM_00255680 [Tetrahymena thermophila SB210]|eukprot:XP_001019122.2 hypothetical protein TTHERM_00255680 [Tetrahymena thermophila SB210]